MGVVELVPVKILDAQGVGDTASAIAGIDYAIGLGVDIMSNSWGIDPAFASIFVPNFDELFAPLSQALYEAIERAQDAGIVFVAAAGNVINFGIFGYEADTSFFADNEGPPNVSNGS